MTTAMVSGNFVRTDHKVPLELAQYALDAEEHSLGCGGADGYQLGTLPPGLFNSKV